MESFKSNKEANSRGRKVEIQVLEAILGGEISFLVVFQVENKKEEEELEKKLDNLTDKLLGALQTGTQTPEEGQEKSDLGFLWHIFN